MSPLANTETAPVARYMLDIPADERAQMGRNWFWLSVAALAGAGTFSVLLVLARMPAIGEMIPYADFFHTALVIHVNLSVLVWILAFAGILWSLASRRGWGLLNRAIFGAVTASTMALALTGFLPEARPLMSNYIPVLQHPVFLSGLVVFGLAVGVQVLVAMQVIVPVGERITAAGVTRFGLNCAAISVVIAIGAFVWSWLTLPTALTDELYYEMLFWGGGHVLQYTYTLLMMVCWLWLASVAGIHLMMGERVVALIFLIGLLSVFIAPVIYYAYPVTDPMHRQMFTWLMSFGGSLATFPLGVAIYFGLIQSRPDGPAGACAHAGLFSSLLLFGAGGVIGFMIEGNDVTVPAHYHGCIVGVTLALMAVGYDLLARLGYPNVNFRLARVQLWAYAGGQFLHILGLVWSGGYGVARKVAGAEQGLDSIGRIAGMGLMGIGGLISAIGGFLFILIACQAFIRMQRGSRQTGSAPGPE